MDIFSLIKRGGPITSKDLEPKIEDFIPNYQEIMDLNSKNFNPKPINPNNIQHKETNNRNNGFTVVSKKDKNNYKQSCPPLSKEAEKKEIMQAKEDLQKALKEKIKDLEKWDDKAKSDVKKWFGSSDEITRQIILDRSKKMQNLLSSYTANNFKPASDPSDVYAYVYADDDSIIYLGYGFCNAPKTGRNSKMGTLAHEMSHFDSVGGTNGGKPYETEIYGEQATRNMADYATSDFSLNNAENFEYYIEG